MPYSAEHKKATRDKILDSAIKLFSTKGFDQVSIDELMQDAGLTRGAFYSHFKSKQAVYAKAMVKGAKQSQITQAKPDEIEDTEWIKRLLSGYLSVDHVTQKISPCPLAFLITDIANNETEVQDTYTRIFKRINAMVYSHFANDRSKGSGSQVSQQDVFSAIAMMIGGVAISRALNDDELMLELLDSCKHKVNDILQIDC